MGLNEASRNHIALTFLEPRGVAVAISAFNHPLNLVVHQVAPAVAAGCPVLIKPSLLTPLSCRHFVELLGEAGLPEGWCQMLICDNDVAERLVRDRRNAFLSFIGSAKVGWSLRALLPPGASCTLEHGGLAPMIVDETADWKKAMPSLVRGCFYHAGQVCVSGQRLFVHDSLYEDFVADFVESVRQIRAGDPNDPHVLVGPLISPREVERVETWVREAQEGGGRILCGGHRISERVFAPTVVENAPPNSTLVTREVFGPVVCIESYETLDRALQKANSVPEYFQASLFTRDLQRALSISRELNGMAVMVNECSAFRTDWMPFGGHRTSGLGVGGIGPMIKQLCVERMVVFGHEEGRE
jgi:acyl-CoA reductase-like NAD-dependent aldehyde dehydrogenase